MKGHNNQYYGMKQISKIAVGIFWGILLVSCSTTRKIPQTSPLTLINNAAEQGNLVYLIETMDNEPFYRDYILSIINDYNYSKTPYSQLKRYALTARNDATATMFFDSLLLHRQTYVIDSLSNLDIADVGSFYKDNDVEHDYLYNVLREAYFSDIPSMDYMKRKVLYKAFKDTDLAPEIAGPYHELRDSLMTDILGALNSYFKSEDELLQQLEKAIRYEAQSYVEFGLEKILVAANEKNERGFFKKIFKRRDEIDRYSFEEYVNKTINEAYNYLYVENLVKEPVAEYIASSNQMRSLLFNQYFSDFYYSDIYIPETALNKKFTWTIGRDDVSNIQSIKNTGTALSVGSLALGFIPGIGTVAVAADVIDLIYGVTEDGQINNAMEQLANTIYKDSSLCIDEFFRDVFGSLRTSRQKTEDNIRKIFNDEF